MGSPFFKNMAWEYRGIKGEGNKNSMVGIWHNTGYALIIVGGSKGVWNDYFKAKEIIGTKPFEVMAINDIGAMIKCDPVHHVISLHKQIPGAIKTLRKCKSKLEQTWGHSTCKYAGVDIIWQRVARGSDSGHFAARVGIAMGFDKIILCGMRMDNKGHFFDPEDARMNNTTFFKSSSHRTSWAQFSKYKNILRCVEGMPAAYLGKPTKGWINDGNKNVYC